MGIQLPKNVKQVSAHNNFESFSSMFVVYTFGAIFLSIPFFNITVLRADSLLSDAAITISVTFFKDEFAAIFFE